MFIASEGEMLRWVLDRNKVGNASTPIDIPDDQIWEISLDPFRMKTLEIPAKVIVSANDNSRGGALTEADRARIRFAEREAEQAEAIAADKARQSPVHVHRDLPHNPVGENVEAFINRLLKLYPSGSYALFEPRTTVQQGQGTAKETVVTGTLWAPGRPAVRAVVTIPEKDDDEIYINPEVPLIGKILNLSRRNDQVTITLENLRKSSMVLKDVDDRLISHEEWIMVCNMLACDNCAKAPKKGDAEYTQVKKNVEKIYRVLCKECIECISDPSPTKALEKLEARKPEEENREQGG
jgi:hypothetical protein